MQKDFSNVSNFTDYMAKVYEFIATNYKAPLNILDIPAGNGLLSAKLKVLGHKVISADINNFHTDYVYQNIEEKLKFEDSTFDIVICLEGIEHIVNKWQLVSEFKRVLNKKGKIIISLPNIQNYYSRLTFLFTGEFFLYNIDDTIHPKGKIIDRGHVNRLSFYEIIYMFEEYNLILGDVLGDKFKKKIFFPFYLIINFFQTLYFVANKKNLKHSCHKFFRSSYLNYSRSLILIFDNKQ